MRVQKDIIAYFSKLRSLSEISKVLTVPKYWLNQDSSSKS